MAMSACPPEGEHHIFRFDVTMHHAAGVRIAKCICYLGEQSHRFVDWQLALARQSFAQRFALDIRHDIIEETVGGSRIMNAQNVRMLQAGGDFDFLHEAIGAEGGREVGTEDLECYLALVVDVFGEIHRRHPALAQLALDDVAVTEGSIQAVDGVKCQSGLRGEVPLLIWCGAYL